MSHWHYQLMYHEYEEPDEIDGEGSMLFTNTIICLIMMVGL